MKKDQDWICPHCGDSEYIECYDTEFDDGFMMKRMLCNRCNKTWREYFTVKYTGYYDIDLEVEYDEDGNVIVC